MRWLRLVLCVALMGVQACGFGAQASAPDYPALVALIHAGKTDALRQVLATKSVDAFSPMGRSLLIAEAVSTSQADIVALLPRWGIAPNQVLAFKQQGQQVKITPLLLAVSAKGGLPTVAALVEGGADPNLTSEDLLPLHFSLSLGQFDTAGYLLDHGALAGKADGSGVTPLMNLALGADDANPATTDMAKRLIAAGNVDARARKGMTALRCAVLGRKPNLVKLLLAAHADPNDANDKGETLLQAASRKQYPEIVDLLLNAGAHS